jgi:hypothetical protein
MSELKGQILGVLLVLMIFGAMSIAFKGIFQNASNAISAQVSDQLDI